MMFTYESFSGKTRRAITLVLLVVLFGLMIATKVNTFGGGMTGGLIAAMLLQEGVRYLRRQKPEQS